MNGDLVTMAERAFVRDGAACWLQQRVRGSRCGINLPQGQSLLFERESEKLLIYLIDMFFYYTHLHPLLVGMCFIMFHCFRVFLGGFLIMLQCCDRYKTKSKIRFKIILCHVDTGNGFETFQNVTLTKTSSHSAVQV